MYGASILIEPSDWAGLGDLAGAFERAGWGYALCAEGPYAGNTNCMIGATVLAENTSAVTIGTSIAIMYFRHPWLAAASAGNLQARTGGRALLGLGVSHPQLNKPFGIAMPKPVSELRQYIADVRASLTEMQSQTPIWIAAVNDPMARLAGEVADGVIFHHVPLSMLAHSISVVRKAAEEARRPMPTVAAYARVALTDDLAAARELGRDITVAFYGFPFYQKLYERSDFQYEATRIRVAIERGDTSAARDLISNEMMDDYLILGSAKRCRDQLDRFKDVGIDLPLFAPLPLTGVPLQQKFAPLLDEFDDYAGTLTHRGRSMSTGSSKLGWPAEGKLEPIVKFALDDGRALAVASPVNELETLITPTRAFFAVQHFLPPAPLAADDFKLTVGGHTKHELQLALDDLKAMPWRTVRTLMECSGNGQDDFPLSPDQKRIGDPLFAGGTDGGEAPPRLLQPSESFASAGEFTGVPLAAVLEAAGIKRKATNVRVQGRDEGVPDPMLHGLPEEITNVDPFNYDKGLPREKALHPDTILAWAMNGEPLAHLHGAPLRLVVPGWSGNWSVKWVSQIEVLKKRAKCWYQTEYYYYAQSLEDSDREPITTIPVKSIITDPADRNAKLSKGRHVIRGLAWSGAAPVARVDVSLNDGKSWQQAQLEEPREQWMWARWSLPLNLKKGTYTALARATDEVGRVQPRTPEWNILRKNFNGMVPVEITVK